MYILYALMGAVMASLGTVAAKAGLKSVDPHLLTALRGIVMAVVVALAALSFGKVTSAGVASLTGRSWFFIILSAAGGALSWIFFYQALAQGPTVAVAVIDKLSIVFTAILALLVLSERISMQAGIGLIFVALGTVLVAVPWNVLVGFLK
jgi:transporter family protein